MLRYLLALLLIAIATPAVADDRSFVVTNFERIRVDGPFEVRVTVGGGGARASASGTGKVLANLDISVQGGTLVVRKGNGGWGEQGKVDGPAPMISVVVPALRGATVVGGGKLTIVGVVRSQRLDFQLTGTGSIAAEGIDAEDVNATLIGSGGMALSGKTLRARLSTNGNGTIGAGKLLAGDLIVRLDGPGATAAYARFTADLTTTGIGGITVGGNPRCLRMVAPAGGPIVCGGASQ